MLNPPETLRMTFWLKSTCSTMHQGHWPSWLRGVNRIEYPAWAASQLFSNRLFSTRTRRAFFSSNRFLTCQRVPDTGGRPERPAVPPLWTNDGAVTVQNWVTPDGVRV